MAETKLSGPSMEQRIANRLKPSSGSETADARATHGSGPTRTITTIHQSGHQAKHGQDEKGRR